MDYDLVVSFKTGKRHLAPDVGRLLAFFLRLFKPNCSQYANRYDYKSNSYSFYSSENILLLNILINIQDFMVHHHICLHKTKFSITTIGYYICSGVKTTWRLNENKDFITGSTRKKLSPAALIVSKGVLTLI